VADGFADRYSAAAAASWDCVRIYPRGCLLIGHACDIPSRHNPADSRRLRQTRTATEEQLIAL
jgi:hypothetical protein